MPQTTLPVVSRISDHVSDTLKGVRRVAGYTVDLSVEEPDATEGNRDRDGLAVVVAGSPEPVAEGVPVQFSGWAQPYEVVVTRIRSEASDTPVRNLLAAAAADVVRALAADVTRGGLAHDTTFGSPAFDYVGADANAGVVTVPVTVHHQTYYNNPFRSRYESA